MHKFFLWAATAGIACVYCDMAAAKTTFLPDWQNAGLDFKGDGESDLNRDEKLCMEQNSQFKYYTSAQCPKYYALDETCDIDVHYLDCNPVRWCLENGYAAQSCPADKHLYNQCPNNYPYYSKCVCNSEFRYTSSNCSGQYYVAGRSCSDDGSSTQKYTQCLCSPKSSETGCSCTTSCSDGCGGTRTCCTACPPPPSPPSTSSSGGGGGGGGSSSSGGGSSGSSSSGGAAVICARHGYSSDPMVEWDCPTVSVEGVTCWNQNACTRKPCSTWGESDTNTGNCTASPRAGRTCWDCGGTASCNYSFTSDQCYRKCQEGIGGSCVKNGTTYYYDCGNYRCKNGTVCDSGRCV